MPCCSNLAFTFSSINSAIFAPSSCVRLFMTIISSILPRNSGRKVCLACAMIVLRRLIVGVSSVLEPEKPRRLSISNDTPVLEVMITTVFLKLTLRPTLSVSCPSSSSRLKIFGCAFSISSNNTTLYGRLSTASVS